MLMEEKTYRYLEPIPLEHPLKLKDLFSLYAYHYTPSFVFKGEYHEPWELVYLDSGSVTAQTDEVSLVLKPGDLIIHKPMEFHKIKANNVTCSLVIFSFTLEGDGDRLLFPLADRILKANALEKRCLEGIVSKGLSVVNQAPSKTEESDFGSGEFVRLYIETLLLDLINAHKENAGKVAKIEQSYKANAVVLNLLSYLNRHVDEKLCLAKLSADLHYSVSRLSALFKAYEGESVMSYFNRLKIKKACELIDMGESSLVEISAYLSFETPQYFATQFKKYTGFTPSQYRKSVMTKTGATLLDYSLPPQQ